MVSTENIQELREAFLKEYSMKNEEVAHPKDIERVKKDDQWIKRFLLHHEMNQKEALNMMWETMTWRKEYRTNEINDLVKTDLLCQGGFFPHGRDKDGCALFILKCKKYVKGVTVPDEAKRCIVYWFERIEREEKGQPITLFFDMEGCGLINLDMEFTNYLIGLFKHYYPFFLNYILIFEMPWVVSAAFKIIKTWLPEKAVQKIKQIDKKSIKEFVAPEQALTCWGGYDTYTFNFLPEQEDVIYTEQLVPSNSNRKVHFADGSQMQESGVASGDRENDASPLVVRPSSVISFAQEQGELVSTLELENVDTTITLSYKLKTTSPEKFRVRPSVGILLPGEKVIIHVTLLPDYQASSVLRDKFLLMSTPLQSNEENIDFATLWKDTSTRKIYQYRLKCSRLNDVTKNGNPIQLNAMPEHDSNNYNQIATNMNKLIECQNEIHSALKRSQYCQIIIICLMIFIAVIIIYPNSFRDKMNNDDENLNSFCLNAAKDLDNLP